MSPTAAPPKTPTAEALSLLLNAAYSDPRLSMRARGLLTLLVMRGHPTPADDLWREGALTEGRNAIRAMMKELKDTGYVSATRGYDRVQRRFYTLQRFVQNPPATDDRNAGNPGVSLYLVTSAGTPYPEVRKESFGLLSPQAATEVREEVPEEDDTPTTLATGWDAALRALESRYRRPSAPQGSAPRKTRTTRRSIRKSPGTDPDASRKDSTVRRDPDASLGDDIDVADPFATSPVPRRKEHTVRPGSPTDRRHEKAHAAWTAWDLTAEFNARAFQAGAGEVPHQTNSRYLGGAFGSLIAQGSSPEALYECIEMFFVDPRNTRVMGEGYPLWRKFLASVTNSYARAQRRVRDRLMTSNDYYAASVENSRRQFEELKEVSARQDAMEAERVASLEAHRAEQATLAEQRRQERAEVSAASRAWKEEQARLAAEKEASRRADFERWQRESEARLALEDEEELDYEEAELEIDLDADVEVFEA